MTAALAGPRRGHHGIRFRPVCDWRRFRRRARGPFRGRLRRARGGGGKPLPGRHLRQRGLRAQKLLVYGAHYSEDFEQAGGFGWTTGEPSFDWPALIANKNREIERLNGIYRNLLVNSGVTLLEGHARITDPHTVEINGQTHGRAHSGGDRRLAAGAGHPRQGTRHHVQRGFFLEALPRRVLVVGGGYIAVEFASIFNGMGARTTQIYRGPMFLRGFDQGVREHLRDELTKKGIDLRFNANVARIDKRADGTLAATLEDGSVVETDCVFFATGRRAMLDKLGLENTAVRIGKNGFIEVDDEFRTAEPSILAIGDVIGRVPLTPVALAEAWPWCAACSVPPSTARSTMR